MIYLWHIILSHVTLISLVIFGTFYSFTKIKFENGFLQKSMIFVYGVNIAFPVFMIISGIITKQLTPESNNYNLLNITIGKYLVPIGLEISSIRFIFYALFIILPSTVVIYYLTIKHFSLSQSLIILALQLFSILFLFSDNFIQSIFSILCIDFLLSFLLNSFHEEAKTHNNLSRTFLFSTLLGNVFVFTSLLLLVAKIKSFGYDEFQSAFKYHLILSNPYYQLVTISLIIGVIIKLGTFPFQAWLRKIPESFILKEDPMTFILLIYIFFPVLILLVSPLGAITFLCASFLLWYGVISGFIGLMIVYFLSSRMDEFFGFIAVYQSIVLILLSFRHITILTSFVTAFPCVSTIFISFSKTVLIPVENMDNITPFEKWCKKFLTGGWIIVFLLFSIDLIPFNNTLLSFNSKWGSNYDIFTNGLIISSVIIISLFSFLLFRRTVTSLKLTFNTAPFSYLNLIMALFLIINSVLSPIFNFVKFDDNSSYILSSYYAIFFGANMLFLLLLLSLSNFIKPKQPLIKSVIISVQKVLVNIYVPVFYNILAFLYNKVLIRVYLWIKLIFVESVIVEFLYGKLTSLLSELTTRLFALFERILLFMSKVIVFTSMSVKKFDKIKFRWQIIFALFTTMGIFIVFFVYYLLKVR